MPKPPSSWPLPWAEFLTLAPGTHISAVIQDLFFCVWLVSLSRLFLRSIRVVMYQYFIPIYGWIIFHYMHTPHFLYSFTCWWACGLFPPVGYCEECCCKHCYIHICVSPCFISLCLYLVLELMDHMVILFLIFWGTMKPFSTAAALFYLPISSEQEFQFLHIFVNTCYFLLFLSSFFL